VRRAITRSSERPAISHAKIQHRATVLLSKTEPDFRNISPEYQASTRPGACPPSPSQLPTSPELPLDIQFLHAGLQRGAPQSKP